MNFYNVIKKRAEESDIALFCDMDGVIASYDVGKACNFDKKRPLKNNIKELEEIGKLGNVELYILSICRLDKQKDEKNSWLDINAPFFKKENRNIISKENIVGKISAELKAEFLNNFNTDKQKILIDDDTTVLKCVSTNCKDAIVYHNSELFD